MSTVTFDLNSLIELMDELRLAGYDIGTAQYIAAQDLLIELAARGQMPADPRQLRTWLAPIVCSSPREQDTFYRQFDSWVANHPVIDKAERVVSQENARGKDPEQESKAKRSRAGLRPRYLIAAAILLIILVGGYLLRRRVTRQKPIQTLAGKIVDADTSQPLPSVSISFDHQNLVSDANGQFSITYRRDELPKNLVITHEPYERETVPITADTASPLTVQLQQPLPPQVPAPPPASNTPTPRPTATPEIATASVVPIPLVSPAQPPIVTSNYSRALKWSGYGAATLSLMLVGGWTFWRSRLRRGLLEKLRTGVQPRLDEIVVKGAQSYLFQGQSFRRTIQELRRHRQRGASELDTQQTVARTVRNGGLFSPSYGSRQTLPEYLVLIDRASFRDQQARLEEEIVRRLIQDNVFVDTYYFQGDPRLCRKQEISAAFVSLQEMAALHPEHHLIIFSDGSTFINPLSGKPERWIEMFSAWNKRAILTPESPAHWGHRERALAESDLIILPSTREGLALLTEVLTNDRHPELNTNRIARPFPSMLRARPRRWLENHQPKEEAANQLLDELRLFLGSKGFYWLSACAVYPSLYWDLTLYLGFKLFDDRAEIEDRLLSLVRLPWFRHGNIPDWLRLKLIYSLSTDHEQAVRLALEELFVTVLAHPADGIRLDIASGEKPAATLLERLRRKFKHWKGKKSLWQFFKTEPQHSPLRDYVFLTFMSGRRPKKLAVSVPSVFRRALFPEGQAALGLRTVTALLLVTAFSASVFFINRALANKAPRPSIARSQYLQMSVSNQRSFVKDQASKISQALGPGPYEFSDAAIDSIKPYVDYYANRVGNDSQEQWREDLRFVFARASQLYAPTIIPAFRKRGVPVIVGLYIPMAYTEYLDRHSSDLEASGLFQFTAKNANDHGLSFNDRSDVAEIAPAAAAYVSSAASVLGKDARGMSLVLLSYERGVYQVQLDQERFLQNDPKFDGTFWYLQAHANQLNAQFQNEDIRYVPKFFAAAIVGENPQSFGLQMNQLSSYSGVETDLGVNQQIADLIAKFNGADRRKASDQLVQLYPDNKAAVIKALIDALLTDGPDSYRVNLYIVRTLGSIQPNWEGTSEQLAKIQALKTSQNYQDPTFKKWVDRAIGDHVEVRVSAVTPTPTPKPTPPASPSPSPPASPTPQGVTVALSANPISVPEGQDVSFTARLSTPLFGMSYRFNFGDGSQSDWQSSSMMVHRYSKAGSYLSYLEARQRTLSPFLSNRVQVAVYPSGLIAVPNLIGRSESEARKVLSDQAFTFAALTFQDDSSHPAGTVISQQPPPGTPMPKGTKIDVVVARSPVATDGSMVLVPNVLGLTSDQADGTLQKLGLVMKEASQNIGQGQSLPLVRKQSPQAGAKVKPGSVVTVTLCSNPKCP